MSTARTGKVPGEFIKATLLSGVLVILPVGLMLIIVLKIVVMIRPLAAPLVAGLPPALSDLSETTVKSDSYRDPSASLHSKGLAERRDEG